MGITTKRFQKIIWDNYVRNGRKMPWRGEKDPYKVLVSEVMLQQTQVSRVTIKYKEFLQVFPSLQKLAKSDLGSVLKVWLGLGYNRRAKFLHEFSRIIVREYRGKIPDDPNVLMSLPGIGKATAGSLSAFAFNRPVAFIETNIRRVYIHYFFKNKKTVSDNEIFPFVEKTIDITNPREWYYALMDYGAMLKQKVPNPNRKSKHYVKQSRFKGSNREVRGKILKFLSNGSTELLSLQEKIGVTKKRFHVAIESLIKEGMVVKIGTSVYISPYVI